MDKCVSIERLERWASGELGEAEILELAGHVSRCDTCRGQLEECRENVAFMARAKPVLLKSGVLTPDVDEDGSRTAVHSPSPGSLKAKTAPPVANIPDYEMVRELHRGGQGVVYEAVQLSTKRKVAIKVLLDGAYASESARKRFEREIELVASLKHPNIIAIFHPGQTPEGHPYYVMDYVRGLPLHEYVRKSKLTLAETLKLFVAVCGAINHAHQKGVIHRDLKPTNILVDSTGSPKVLDFGLAKMIGGPESTLISKTGQVVGTLPYVSPEQARGNPDDIDTRTDVYALGVILYQVLTGDYPYPVVGQLVEVLQHIAETQPTPPSKAWSADGGVALYGKRSPVARTHCPIDNDVETILLKALAKEPGRRYQSVGELSRDLAHYLAGEPIEAKRDSSLYVLRKMLRRHRKPVALVAVCVACILVVLTVAIVERSRLARKQAELDVQSAAEILAAFVGDPADAVLRVSSADAAVRAHVASFCSSYVSSASFTDRVMGARGGLLVNPEAFWASVDGGELWHNGEWLEVARVQWADPAQVLDQLRDKAINGTPRQRYVAFCLIGEFGQQASGLADVCRQGVADASQVGVASAARWAAMRLGEAAAYPFSNHIIEDDLSGMTFLRIEGSPSFEPGAKPDDDDRYPDERTRGETVAVDLLYLSSTEVTLAVFEPFFRDKATRDLFGPFDQGEVEPNKAHEQMAGTTADFHINQRLESLTPDQARQEAVSWVTHKIASRFCEWLTARAAGGVQERRYRLPTEDEWEYAAMAGGTGRFCFGNDDDYVPYFGHCRGKPGDYHVARQMPNYFGLFDMHGGLWEVTDTKYRLELVPADKLASWKSAGIENVEVYTLKGGGFYSPAVRCRPSQRNYANDSFPGQYWGFRIVMEPIKK